MEKRKLFLEELCQDVKRLTNEKADEEKRKLKGNAKMAEEEIRTHRNHPSH